MKITLRCLEDLPKLRSLARDESDALQRDRYRVVLLTAEGLDGQRELTREQIAAVVGRSRQFVDEWVRRYRRGGIDALRPPKRPGRAPFLSPEQKQQLCEALDAGPQEGDPRSVLFGQDIRELIHCRFGVLYSPSGVYKLLSSLGYSWLCPRPRHPQSDPAQQEAFKKKWASRSRPSATSIPSGVC